MSHKSTPLARIVLAPLLGALVVSHAQAGFSDDLTDRGQRLRSWGERERGVSGSAAKAAGEGLEWLGGAFGGGGGRDAVLPGGGGSSALRRVPAQAPLERGLPTESSPRRARTELVAPGPGFAAGAFTAPVGKAASKTSAGGASTGGFVVPKGKACSDAKCMGTPAAAPKAKPAESAVPRIMAPTGNRKEPFRQLAKCPDGQRTEVSNQPRTGDLACVKVSDQLLKTVDLNGGGDQKRADLLKKSLAGMVDKSPTARELAGRWVDEGLKGEVKFEEMQSTKYKGADGKDDFYGVMGFARPWTDPIEVRLNDKYVETGRDFRGTLAHELLGHGLEHGVAKKKGNDFSYGLYRGDETAALLVGARVEQELGLKVRNSRVSSYLRDPEAYYEQNMFLAPAYAVGLSLDEMKKPVESLKDHKELVSRHRTELIEERKALDAAIKKNAKDKAAMDQRAEVQTSIDTQDESIKAIDGYVKALEGDKKLLEQLQKDADSEQFQTYQKALDEDAEYLRKALYPPKKK